MRAGRTAALFVAGLRPQKAVIARSLPHGCSGRQRLGIRPETATIGLEPLVIAAPSRLVLAPWPCGDQAEDIVPGRSIYPRGVGFLGSGCEPEPYNGLWLGRSQPAHWTPPACGCPKLGPRPVTCCFVADGGRA